MTRMLPTRQCLTTDKATFFFLQSFVHFVVLCLLLCLIPSQVSAQSLKEVQKAAEQGDAKAANSLGVWYEKGQMGLQKDPMLAVSWYLKAAQKGHVLAMHNLGDCYLQGVGTSKNAAEAYAWYKKAAESGGAIGYEDIGNFFKNIGFDGPNVATAKIWYSQAARQGRKSAQEKLLDLGGPRLKPGKPFPPCPQKRLGEGSMTGTLLDVANYGPQGSQEKRLQLSVRGKKETLFVKADAVDTAMNKLLTAPQAFQGKEIHLDFAEIQGLDDHMAVCTTHRQYLSYSLKNTDSEAKTSLATQKPDEIYIAYDNLLLGAYIQKAWVDVESLQNNPKYKEQRVWGGQSGRIYTAQGFSGEGIMSALFNDHPEEHADKGPLAEFPFFTLQTPQGNVTDEVLFIAGSGKNFEPFPRKMRPTDNNAQFTKLLRGYLAQNGIRDSNPKSEVFAVDFDGDRRDEYIISAINFTDEGIIQPGHGKNQLYSVLLLVQQKDGQDVITPVVSFLCPKIYKDTLPVKYFVKMCADVNGDGILELLVYSAYYEGGGMQIYSFEQDGLHLVLEQGWGV